MSWAHLAAEGALSYADAMRSAYSTLPSYGISSGLASINNSIPDPIGSMGSPISWKSPTFDYSSTYTKDKFPTEKWVKYPDGVGYYKA